MPPRGRRATGWAGLAVSGLLASAPLAGAQAPAGAEFQVNTYTTDYQILASVARAGGGFVVTWQSAGSFGTDSSDYSIQGQRYASGGSLAGGQFQVNSHTANDQDSPSVAATSAGSFSVVWESRGSPATDQSSWSVQGQRFASDGLPDGAQFQVNTAEAYAQIDPSALALPGELVVVWHGYSSAGSDTGPSGSIHGQRYALPLPAAVPSLSPSAAAGGALLLLLAARAALRRRA